MPKNAFTPDERPATKDDVRQLQRALVTHSVGFALIGVSTLLLIFVR
ncbi:hypothetical protein ACGFZU_35135 [Streptomyces tendae]